MKIGARNRVVGKVTRITTGTVMCLVKVQIPNPSEMASVMTLESLEDLGIREGDEVEVVAKAVNVLPSESARNIGPMPAAL
jgi:molybdopterin-binding protein